MKTRSIIARPHYIDPIVCPQCGSKARIIRRAPTPCGDERTSIAKDVSGTIILTVVQTKGTAGASLTEGAGV